MIRKRVIVITTGGTISSGGVAGGVSPRFSGNDLLTMAASREFGPPESIDVEILEFSRVLSGNMEPVTMYELADRIWHAIEAPDVAGAVITHGTGAIEETSFMVDLYHASRKPVVFTGAMRPVTDPDSDGLRNLHDAIVVAAHEDACENGVLLVMNSLIFSARDVTKGHSSALETFQSEFGPIGAMGPGGKLSFFRCPVGRQVFPHIPPEPNVDLLRFYTGMDGRFIRASIQAGAKGIVVEGSGLGNVNETVARALKETVEQGVVVVMASRCVWGTAYPFYSSTGGGADLARAGVFFSSYLSGLKSRLLLCAALSLTRDRDQLSSILSGGMFS
jgi:L-asparaginase